MDSELQERIEILYQGEQISLEIKEILFAGINFLEKEWEITVTEENGAMFITHLAMSLMRIKKGEGIDSVNPVVATELEKAGGIAEFTPFFDLIAKCLQIEIPEEEKNYLALYLKTILAKKNVG